MGGEDYKGLEGCDWMASETGHGCLSSTSLPHQKQDHWKAKGGGPLVADASVRASHYDVGNTECISWTTATKCSRSNMPISNRPLQPRTNLLTEHKLSHHQAAKCKWRALRHTCLLLLSILGGMPASHQGMQA